MPAPASSEVSDDDEEIESVADLSENDGFGSLSTLQPTATADKDEDEDKDEDLPHLRDKAVNDENALNSYDYIEAVERD